MVTTRGGIYWADLGLAADSDPAKHRPVLVVQSDAFNATGLATTVVVALSSNLALAHFPGNVFLPATVSGLPRDSVANVIQISTIDKSALGERASTLPLETMREVDEGIAQVLASWPG